MGCDPFLEGAFDGERAPAARVRRAEKGKRVEDAGPGAGTGCGLAAEEIAAVALQFDRAADAQRPSEVAQPPGERIRADGTFANRQFEIAEQLPAGTGSA